MTTSRKRFLDPTKIEAAIAEIAKVAAKDDITVALAGGCALQLYGSDRFTLDVDILADVYPASWRSKGALAFGGMKTKTARGVPIDVIVRHDQYADLYKAALGAAHRVAGVPVPVVTLPYLAAMKMAAGRGKDLQDLEFIVTGTRIPYNRIRALVAEHLGVYAADELDALKQEWAWRRTTQRPRRKP